MSTPATVPMLSPDGQMGDVPQANVSAAVKSGFKIGADLVAPNGKHGIVPLDRVHDAISAGFMLKGGDPSAPPNPMKGDLVGGAVGAASDIGDMAAGVAKNAYQVSAPGIATSIIKDKAPTLAEHLPQVMKNNATPLQNLPEQIVTNGALMLTGEPGVPSQAPEAAAAKEAALPVEAKPVQAPEVSKPDPKIDTSPKSIEQKINDSLGGKPLQPGVKLRDQFKTQPEQASGVPAGHTPIEGSSVLNSYKYDPSAREFEYTTNNGAHYILGDVSPEQVNTFEAADSKGKAWNELKKNATPVGKVVNGTRVNVQPPSSLRSASPDDDIQGPKGISEDDLPALLQESLKQARAVRAAKAARMAASSN